MTMDLEANLSAQLTASIMGLTAAMKREADWRARQMQVIRQVPFFGSIAIASTNGGYDQPDALQAKTGYTWSVRRMTVQGFSAGTVTAYRNGNVNPATGLNAGEPLCPYPVPAVNTFAKGQMVLNSTDRIVWGAVGVALLSGYSAVQFWGVADCMEAWYLPYYLG
jgi:hypothetical protein